MRHINIVLHEPEIPQNTGNIARTCAAIGASLHLIRPFGFEINNYYLRRAGLDYWEYLDIHYYDNLDDFYAKNPGALIYYFSKKAKNLYTQVEYKENVFLMFGRESRGLDESLLVEHQENSLRIPMREGLRSLNLSNCVAIVAYEALRQNNFEDLELEGKIG